MTAPTPPSSGQGRFTYTETGIRLGVSEQTIGKWARAGKIRVIKINARKVLVPEEEVTRLLAERDAQPAA